MRNPFAITTQSLARYISYSLRQIFRFLGSDFDWYAIRTLFFMTFFNNTNKHYLKRWRKKWQKHTRERLLLQLYDVLLDYYYLRFQIEFDFRDAKQHFGLSDFKNDKEKNMTNFVNLSFTMTLVVKKMLQDSSVELANEKIGILDI